MMRLLAAFMLLFAAARAPVWAAPEPAERRAPSAVQIADALVSRDPAANSRGLEELLAADARTCESLGEELNLRGAREAESILQAVAMCRTANALIAAFIALENPLSEIRSAALDAVLAAPFSLAARSGDEFLKGSRRQRLFEILTSPEELAARCDAVARDPDGTVSSDPRMAINLCLVADRFYGAAGFCGTLRGLSRVMIGSDVPYPPEVGPSPTRKPGEPQSIFNKRDREWSARKSERDRRMEDFNRALRRRQAAEAMFRFIWISDLTQFNYVVSANYAEREAAVARMVRRLDAMEAQSVDLGGRQFRGVRCGDHLMELWASDVAEFKACSYLRMRAISGEDVPLHGEGYAKEVGEFNAMSRRQLAELRKNLKAWWTQYREQTEPR
jgi:hypothetical protein